MSDNEKMRLENLLLDDSFVRYVKGIANEEERHYWHEWQHQSADHQDLLKDAKELIEFTEYNAIRIPDPHIELKKLNDSINRKSIHPKISELENRFEANRQMRSSWFAAAFILILISFGVFHFVDIEEEILSNVVEPASSTSEYHTGFGEKAFLHLTDGSRIVLNAQSNLSYAWSGSRMNGQQTDIYLDGEAWFDIEPSKDEESRLLRVHTQDGIVEVTGTVFTVQTTTNGTLAVLKKGEIQISPKSSSNDEAEIPKTILTPGKMAQFFSDSDQVRIQNVNPEVYTSWVRDVWTFEQTPLNKIATRIETVFGVEVRILSTDLKERTLSGTISSRNLKLISEGLSEALQVQVRQIDNKILIGPES